jgi:hypothetical protein
MIKTKNKNKKITQIYDVMVLEFTQKSCIYNFFLSKLSDLIRVLYCT